MAAIKKVRFQEERPAHRLTSEEENVLKELREKMHRLKFRLLDCQNQNQMLRKELLVAKKVMNKEIAGGVSVEFPSLLMQGVDTTYKGRQEKIIFLKNQIQKIQNRIQELEGECPEDKLCGECEMKQEVPADDITIKHDVNSPHIRQNMVELNDLIARTFEKKKKVEAWKCKNKELKQQAKVLHLELERLVEKSKDDQHIQETYPIMERELRERQTEKVNLRSRLDESKTRNNQLVAEISMLKDDLSGIISKTNDDKMLIEALNSQQAHLQDMVDRQTLMYEDENRKFKENLRKIQTKHGISISLLLQLKEIMNDKDSLLETLKNSTPLVVYIAEREDETKNETAPKSESELKAKEEAELPSSEQAVGEAKVEGEEESISEATSVADHEVEQMEAELQKHKALFQSTQDEVERLASLARSNNSKQNEWMSRLLQSVAIYSQRIAEVRELQETVKRLQFSLSSTKKKKMTSEPEQPKSSLEEMTIKKDIEEEEHNFLFNFWKVLTVIHENNYHLYNTVSDCMKKLYLNAIQDCKNSFNANDNITVNELTDQAAST
ncbi:intersectin-2-like [Stegodyphus dumicola]|uniref:intersectin-2-like n=1 Tax=Stegodyphus dumicola TaxID=202533 RepID=UPI0015AD0F33|nr:intersectin-2-like [Stegodyphus dumicola]